MQRAFPQTQPAASLTQFTCCKQAWEPQGERKQHFIVPEWGKLPWGHCKSWCIPGKKLCCSHCEQERPGSGLLPSLGSGMMRQGCREDLPCGCTVSCSCKSTTDQPCQLQQLTRPEKVLPDPWGYRGPRKQLPSRRRACIPNSLPLALLECSLSGLQTH